MLTTDKEEAKNLVLHNFPLDRIVSIEAIDIPYQGNERFDTEHFFDNVIGVSKKIIILREKLNFGHEEQSNYIKTKPIHRSQKLISENQEDGSCIFKIEVVVNYEIHSVFMSYGPGIKIISPKFVAKNLERKFKKSYQQYKNELQENENYKED